MMTDSTLYLETEPSRLLGKIYKGFLWAGVAMIVLGVAAIIMPMASSLLIELLIGVLLTVSGLVSVLGAFSLRKTGLFFWELIAGLITFAVGLLMLLFPTQGLVALTVLVAGVLVLTGVAQFAFALWARAAAGWVWALVSGLISIGLGGYILFALPEVSTMALGILLGVDFVSTGVALVLIAQSVRRALQT